MCIFIVAVENRFRFNYSYVQRERAESSTEKLLDPAILRRGER